MNCFQHPDLMAVAQCAQCGRGLCIECAQKQNENLLCEQCAAQQKTTNQANYQKIFIACAIFAVIGFSFTSNYSQEPSLLSYLFFRLLGTLQFAAAPIGWNMIGRVIKNFSSKYILALPIGGIVFLYFAKAILSVMFGIFTVPFFIKRYKQDV